AMAAGLEDVKAVYLLPMSRGMDQYLAERLAGQNIFQVVTDPNKADAIFTDRIGSSFEANLTELYKPPVEVKDSKEAKPEAEVFPAAPPCSRFHEAKAKSSESTAPPTRSFGVCSSSPRITTRSP